MSASEPSFSGANGTECEGFIKAVRKYAFKEGKQKDYLWIAEYAATCFEGPALRWHRALPEEVRSDWRLLEENLLSKYPASASG